MIEEDRNKTCDYTKFKIQDSITAMDALHVWHKLVYSSGLCTIKP